MKVTTVLLGSGRAMYRVRHKDYGTRVLTRGEVDALLVNHRDAIGTDTYDALMDSVAVRR